MGSLSSIPRWRYADVLEALGRETGTPRSEEALMALLDSARGIIIGKNFLVEKMVNNDKSSGAIRICLYAALMRTAIYLSEKDKRVTLLNIST